jgi:hypothetical protein
MIIKTSLHFYNYALMYLYSGTLKNDNLQVAHIYLIFSDINTCCRIQNKY